MDRKKFLSSIGTTAACICVGGMAACVKTSEPPAGSSNNISIDLTNQLNNVGDYLVSGPYAIVRAAVGNTESSFYVLSRTCPHAGFSVDYDLGLGHFRCPGHFSEFALNGSRISGAAPRGLDKLTFTVVGDKLIIET